MQRDEFNHSYIDNYFNWCYFPVDGHVSGEKALLFNWGRWFPTEPCDCESMEHHGIMAFTLLYAADSIRQKVPSQSKSLALIF